MLTKKDLIDWPLFDMIFYIVKKIFLIGVLFKNEAQMHDGIFLSADSVTDTQRLLTTLVIQLDFFTVIVFLCSS